MKILTKVLASSAALLAVSLGAGAQYRDDAGRMETAHAEEDTIVLTLDQALEIALSENFAVKVADKEIERSEYARKGTYASLFPQVNANGSYQRTIKKQVMYMDFDMGSFGDMTGGGTGGEGTGGESTGDYGLPETTDKTTDSSGGGFEVGRWNTFYGGVDAAMPLVNFQLWKSIQLTGDAVELAVEQARSSRLDMVTQVKQAYYSVLLAKEAFNVYRSVYENAVENFNQTEMKYKAAKASELDYTRSKTNVANAIPNVYNAESQIILALWQLKAVMGVDLDMNIDVAGTLEDFADNMAFAFSPDDSLSLDGNTSLRQLAIQAEQLAKTVQMQKYAYLPTLAANISYSMNAMTNDFKFSQYRWTPYSYIGLSLSIPIFSGGKRYNDVRQARVQATELDLQKINTERQLRIAIRQYLNTMETNVKSYSSAQEAVSLAQKAYDVSVKSYNVGKSTITDLNDAQLALTQAKLSESQAIYNFVVAKSNLEQTLGYDFLDENGKTDLKGSYGNKY